jgi:hypothetical protein
MRKYPTSTFNHPKKEENPFPIYIEVILKSLSRGKYEEAKTLMGHCRMDFSWKNHLILREYTKRPKEPKQVIQWILEQGQYNQRHKLVALCMYAFCGKDKEIEATIKTGVNHEIAPEGWEELPIYYCLPNDYQTPFETLLKKSTYPTIQYAMLKACQLRAEKCFIKGLAYIPTRDSLLASLWAKWGQHSMPKPIEVALLKRADTKILEEILKQDPTCSTTISKEITLRKIREANQMDAKIQNSLSL